MKRIYKTVTIAPEGQGWSVLLDNRPVRTPVGTPLSAPNRDMAQAIADEWDAQGDSVKPDTMPLTQFLSTALDRVAPMRHEMIEGVLTYAQTDLLCYRAEHPNELVARQAQVWQPLLDWAALRYDAVLCHTSGIIHRPQSPDALRALKSAVEALDNLALTGLQNAVAASGSLVLGLALVEERIDAEQAFLAAHLDELFQTEKWGEDAEAAQRRTALRDDLAATERFLKLAKVGSVPP